LTSTPQRSPEVEGRTRRGQAGAARGAYVRLDAVRSDRQHALPWER
jgi:hypothetical protein